MHEYQDIEKLLSDSLGDCKEMLKYIIPKSKRDKDSLKKYKKSIKEMKKKLDEGGLQNICEV